MDILERLKARTGETNEALLNDCIESAKHIYLSRRYPFVDPPLREITVIDDETGEETTTEETYVETRYLDWQYRCALAIYSKDGADGQLSHSENGISRTYGSEGIPKELLTEIPPYIGVPH